jgi:predicted transcriptional regulator of viral defense system
MKNIILAKSAVIRHLSQTKNWWLPMSYNIKGYIRDLQKKGVLTFSLREIRESFPSFSEVAIKSALRRVSDDNEVISVRKGFYVIIPAGYALRGTVPPELYIDDLMKHLCRPYYVSLLNAAAYYGAAHQQPQGFTVVTAFPPLRDAIKKGVYVNFISTRKEIPQAWLRPFRTESGDIQVSRPELTAADLITYQKEIGGLNRASAVLYELSESLNFGQLDKQFFDFIPVSTVQRLGYLLECIFEQSELAEELYTNAQTYKLHFQKIPLKRIKKMGGFAANVRWKVVVNEQLEVDDL